MKTLKYMGLLAAMLCVGLQASIKDAIDSKSVEQVNAALQADASVLNDFCIEEKMAGFQQPVSVFITPLMYAVAIAKDAKDADSPIIKIIRALLDNGANPKKGQCLWRYGIALCCEE